MGAASTLGFDWGGLFSNIGTSVATGVAQAGTTALQKAIIGTPNVVAVAPPAPSPTASLGAVPIWAWALGGMGLVLVLILAMGRR